MRLLKRSSIFAFALITLCVLAVPAPGQENADPASPQTLFVGTKLVKPFAFKTPDGKWTGISIDLWKAMQEELGYSYEWKEAPNTDSLVQMVAKGEVDIGMAAITMKPSRVELVDFSNSMFESGVGIAVRASRPGIFGMIGRFVSAELLMPLLSLCGLLFFIGFLVWLFERRVNAAQFEPNSRGLWSGFWWSAVTMTTVGYGDKAPVSVAGRIIGLLWMFASIMITSFFTAAIASSLTTEQLQSTVRGEGDLYRVEVGARKGESPAAILRERGISPIEFNSLREGLVALSNGEIQAFVHDTAVIEYEINESADLGESLMVLRQPLRAEEYGIAVTRPEDPLKRNIIVDQINNALLELKISGKYNEIVQTYLGR